MNKDAEKTIGKILCYGDSNTYGYDPRSYFGERYDADSRWPDILEKSSGWEIVAAGQNGRELPKSEAEFAHLDWMLSLHRPDVLLIVLGTNDILNCRVPFSGSFSNFGSSNDSVCAASGSAEAGLYEENPEQRAARIAVETVSDRMRTLLSHLQKKHKALRTIIVCPVPEDTGITVYDEGTRLLTPAFRALAETYGVGCIETLAWEIDLCFDGSHYTEDGHRRFAEKLREALREIL